MIPLSIVKWIIIFRARIVPIFQESCCRFSNLDKRKKRLFYKQEKKAIFLTKKTPKKQKQKQKQTNVKAIKWYGSKNLKWALWSFFLEQIKLENRKNEIDEKKIRATTLRSNRVVFHVLNKSTVGLSFKMIQCILLRKIFNKSTSCLINYSGFIWV